MSSMNFRRRTLAPAVWLVGVWISLVPAVAVDFDTDFTGATLRLDLHHSGTAGEEHLTLNRARIEGPWPGSRTQMFDTRGYGLYYLEMVDLETTRPLYSRGFASIWGEWATTGEAASGKRRTIEEAVRLPEPRRPVQVRFRKRGPDGAFGEIASVVIDPASRHVDRSPVAPQEVWAVVESGDPATKVDLLILGDGYTADEMTKYHADAKAAAEALFTWSPFRERRSDFNVWAIDTPAQESGISRPRAGVWRSSPIGTSYNTFDSERYVLTLEDRRWRDIAAAAPYDHVLILVNERKYGGGGIYQLYSTAAADSSYMDYLVIHEFGHHFAALGDEYYTSDVAYEDFHGALVEPWEPNITALRDPEGIKWKQFVDEGTPLPTPWGKDEYEAASHAYQQERRELRAAGAPEEAMEELFDEVREENTARLGAEPWAGKVGAFEGAGYRATGLYRPAVDCVMFTRDEVGFCPVCSMAIEEAIDLLAR